MVSQNDQPQVDQQAIQGGLALSAIHRFLDDLREGKLPVDPSSEDIDAPLVAFAKEVSERKFPNDPEYAQEIQKLIMAIFRTDTQILLDPARISRLFIAFDPDAVKGAVAQEPDRAGPFPNKDTEASVGKALVRLMRSFLSVSGKLTRTNSFITGCVNYCHPSVGRRLLSTPGPSGVKVAETIFFKQEAPRLYLRAGDDRDALKPALEEWCEVKFKPWILLEHVKTQAPTGTKTIAVSKVENVIPDLADKLVEIIWTPGLLQVLVYHYLFPLWRQPIVDAL